MLMGSKMKDPLRPWSSSEGSLTEGLTSEQALEDSNTATYCCVHLQLETLPAFPCAVCLDFLYQNGYLSHICDREATFELCSHGSCFHFIL